MEQWQLTGLSGRTVGGSSPPVDAMEITLSFKNPKGYATCDLEVSATIADIPYHALHRISKVLPEVAADAYSRLASEIPIENDSREFLRKFMYQDAFASFSNPIEDLTKDGERT